MKKILLLFLVSFSFLISIGQTILRDSSFYRQQLYYLKNDSLPVSISLLPDVINSEFSEFKGLLCKDSVFYFNAIRTLNTEDYENIFAPYWNSSIYYSKLTISGFSVPQRLDKNINNEKYFNTNFTFNENEDKLLFSRCLRNTETDLQCTIWESKLKNGKWTKAEPLPKIINMPNANTNFPHWVEMEDYQILYFSSNRKNGIGGMDLWYAIYKNETFETPVNLGGIINTEGNEITPFFDKKNNTLFFSSDERENLGGYDIFYTTGSLSNWAEPANMGVPFNSEDNDFYLTVNKENNNGYFSSNRTNDRFGSGNKCCNDIYAFQWWINEDSISTDTIEDKIMTISELQSLLPLTLYYDNDQPDPKSTLNSTETDYASTLANYLAKKNIFKSEYSAGLFGNEKLEAESKMDHFFTDSVEREYAELTFFLDNLLVYLQAGSSVTLTVDGYASALHNSDYNLILSERRIGNFINLIRKYSNGIFAPYMAGKTPQLVIVGNPQGNREAVTKQVSSNRQDRRNSVYSIAASLERRIEVVNIEIVNAQN